MPTLVEQALSDEQLKAFCERVRTTPGAARSPTIIQRLMEEAGIIGSKMAASAFRDGPLAKYIERIERSRDITAALVDAAKGGVHGLDAVEEALVIELQDHLAQADEIDLKFLTGQLLKLRTSISLREESRRKQADLERKQRETEARLDLAEKREALLQEQIAKLTVAREEWEGKRRAVAEALDRAKHAPAASADQVRAAAVAEIDKLMGIAR